MSLPDPPILIITDRRHCAEPLENRAAALFRGGCRWLSLREKDMTPPDRLALLRRLIEVAAPFGAAVGVHDDLDAAGLCGAALHLPALADIAMARRALGPTVLLGQSCHSAAELSAAEDADYVTLSPVFASAGKPGYGPALDVSGIATLAGQSAAPVLALGGITLQTLARLDATPIAGVAIMGEAMQTPDALAWFACIVDVWCQRLL